MVISPPGDPTFHASIGVRRSAAERDEARLQLQSGRGWAVCVIVEAVGVLTSLYIPFATSRASS